MDEQLDELFKLNDQHLEKINNQRRRWLYASSIVLTGIIALIFAWDWLDHFHSQSIWWLVVSLMLLISVNWWYWTMKVVYKMLQHQKIEFGIIRELLVDIKEVKSEIKNLGNQYIDKSK